MGRRRKQEEGSGGASWLTTYSDLVTLLLCFFVLLFSMAVVDKQKVEKVALSIRAAFLGERGEDIFDYSSPGDKLISLTPYPNIDEKDLLDRPDEKAGQEGEEYTGTGEDADPDEGEETGETDETVGEAGAMDTLQADIQALIDEMGLNENIRVIDEGTRIILRMDS
ncbi:MAG TPA: flagellar motor protein MotB, partial [Clostridiales bacterium]|nr:flagellar motor protein MotB [Clostridiales bacterium]